MRSIAVLLLTLLFAAGPCFAQGQDAFDKGLDAYNAGDYLGANTYFRDSAEEGNASAMFMVGALSVA